MEKKWWTLLAVCVGTFMLLLDVTIVNVALPDVQHSLKASFSDLQWVVDAYALTLAALLLTSGSLADLYGRRRLFLIGLVVFTAGSLACGVAQSAEMLILSRSAQGVGGAIMFSTSLALLAQAFQGRERGTAFGIWGAITGLAVAVGPVLGGLITTGLTWRWIFLVNVPIGLFALIVTAWRVEDSREPGAHRPDWAGFVFFTVALIALVYGLIRSSERSWGEPGVVACFAVSAVMLIVFLFVERSGQHPMFDLSLFRKPTFVGGSVAAFGMSASIFALLLYVVLYLQNAKGYSALDTGLRLLILSAGIMASSTLAGRLTSHVPIRLLIGPGLLLVGIGLALMARLSASSSWTLLIPGFLVAGVGVGMVNPPLASTAVGVVEPARAGMASGINSTFRQVGIATGVAAFGSVFGSQLSHQLARNLRAVPELAGRAHALAGRIRGGDAASAVASAPPALRRQLQAASLQAFVHALDVILVAGAVLAILSGVAALLLIRSKDFAAGSQRHQGDTGSAGPPDTRLVSAD